MYRVTVRKENSNNVPFLNKIHCVEREDLVKAVWDYLKEFNRDELSWTKSMTDLQGKSICGRNSSYITTVKIEKIVTVPPNSNENEVPEWFKEII